MSISRRAFFKCIAAAGAAIVSIPKLLSGSETPKLSKDKNSIRCGRYLTNPHTMNRVGVRRLVLYVRKRCTDILKNFTFEVNDEATRDQIRYAITTFLQEGQSKGGFGNFVVACDESNNPPHVINQGSLKVDIWFQPFQIQEYIGLEFSISGTTKIFEHFTMPAVKADLPNLNRNVFTEQSLKDLKL